jgi:D-alanine--poly(phosphoribitol) ligase subunit 1
MNESIHQTPPIPGLGSPAAANVLNRILRHALDQPTHPAAKDASQELDYAGLACAAGALAAGLIDRGVGPGDRVALDVPNSVDFVVAALACLWAGAIFVPLAVGDPLPRINSVIEDCDPVLVLMTADRDDPLPRSAAIAALSRPDLPTPPMPLTDGPAYAIYTSGTTGTPKGVVIGQAAFAAAVHSAIDQYSMDVSTRAMCVSPFHFDGSFAMLFPTLAAGGTLVIPSRDSFMFPRFF